MTRCCEYKIYRISVFQQGFEEEKKNCVPRNSIPRGNLLTDNGFLISLPSWITKALLPLSKNSLLSVFTGWCYWRIWFLTVFVEHFRPAVPIQCTAAKSVDFPLPTSLSHHDHSPIPLTSPPLVLPLLWEEIRGQPKLLTGKSCMRYLHTSFQTNA